MLPGLLISRLFLHHKFADPLEKILSVVLAVGHQFHRLGEIQTEQPHDGFCVNDIRVGYQSSLKSISLQTPTNSLASTTVSNFTFVFTISLPPFPSRRGYS